MNRIVRYLPSVAVATAAVLVSVQPAFAQSADTFFNSLKLDIFTSNNPNAFLNILMGLINLFLIIGGIVAFIFVLLGGWTYLTAGGDSNAAGKGRTMIVNAIIGIIIIFLSYSLVRFVTNRFSDDGGNTTFDGADSDF